MNYDEAVALIDAHADRGMNPGLERIEGLLALMGNPQHAYSVIHVAGSNGKTSTTRLIATLAASHGMSVATYTSPHLHRIEDRLQYNGVAAAADEFAQAVDDVRVFEEIWEQRGGDLLTYFEFMTAVALAWFADRGVDLAVIEVGLGGRLDATNVVSSEVAVVTGIELEHTEQLGDTISAIAGEKIAIAKPDGILVTGDLHQDALEVAAAHSEALAIPWYTYDRDFAIVEASQAVGGWLCDIRGLHATYTDLLLPTHGRIQVHNLAVAIAALEALFDQAMDVDAARAGLAAVENPGRIEVLARQPLVVVDVAHTPNAASRLLEALEIEFPPLRWQIVMGASREKDAEGIIDVLGAIADGFTAVAADHPRSLDPAELLVLAEEHINGTVSAASSVAEGLDQAMSLAGFEGAVLIVGSVFVAGEARSALLGIDNSPTNGPSSLERSIPSNSENEEEDNLWNELS
ncbi:MAG: bifunctional folylpolyglutamate synthase/dihydrofolate synthase [Acidimicrobiia bacterium]|nr:bifunctional folylpolyglutamate synthase/dihydrofolate synthase [Acidimicrobiia bacterium]NNL29362.1 bifunctional folylpolyglutamate synthase/dihydrofolate synthase [Acidimicrobiia bacterium]